MRPFPVLSLLLIAVAAALPVQGQNANPWAPEVQLVPNTVAADLIGEWSKSKVSSIDFVDRSTGAHADPSGERLNVRFFPDGHYKLGRLLQSSLYSCTSTLTSKDTCHREWNYEKHPPLRQTTYEWRLARTKYGPALVMRGPNGKDVIYMRENGRGLLEQ